MFQKLAGKLKQRGAAAGLVAALACAAPAQAAIFAGDWDPAFGPAFPDLGWRGEAKFFIPDACLALSGSVSNFNPCSSLEMKIISAEVEFYKLSDPTNPAFQETLVFDISSGAVLSVNLDDGQLLGVLGGFPYFRSSALPLAGAPYTEFLLSFLEDVPVLYACTNPPGPHNTRCYFSDFTSENRPTIVFQRVVAEPGALALLGLGLGMIGLVARPRRRESGSAH